MSDVKKVLVIGDSISIGYTPYLADELDGLAVVAHNEGNGGTSANILANLEAFISTNADARLVVLNCGLHDLKRERPGGELNVSIEQYSQDLSRVLAILAEKGREVIWARITPVNEVNHGKNKPFDRYQKDVDAFNAAADEVVSAAGAASMDLHAKVTAAGADECIVPDGVHLTDDAYKMLGKVVASHVRGRLAD